MSEEVAGWHSDVRDEAWRSSDVRIEAEICNSILCENAGRGEHPHQSRRALICSEGTKVLQGDGLEPQSKKFLEEVPHIRSSHQLVYEGF